ncbi:MULTISPECIES: MurR/RpiR family transcriptional regulator [Sporosarcina]|uniref:MurR/RpiR family transcriptional regulator n=1 Tax=Sporosarcina TaxID=1569 RepID=UPI00058B58B9|nr:MULTISPECIES: MurR/RpiR family transcriptional regulator [Sporosarcina]WJY26373.1 MurR/RpiR family transcriptional regulator [Sporosarcina sp. 0.2-SM1T-5]
MNNTLERIKQGLHSLSPSEKKVAAFILNDPACILTMPIAELSAKSHASEATIIRMCRALQFKGYHDLKLGISASLSSHQAEGKTYYADMPADQGMDQIVDYVSYTAMQSIKSTISLVDRQQMEAVVELLLSARRIAVLGVGASGIVALDFEQKCKRIDTWCEALTDSHTQLMTAVHLTEKDVMLAISYSGETKEIVEAVQVAKQRGVSVISLTRYGSNKVRSLADIALYASPTEHSIRSGATVSRISQLTVIDILFMGMVSKNPDSSVERLNRTREVIRNRK